MVSSASKTKYQISTSCIKCKSQQSYYKLMQQIQIIPISLSVFSLSAVMIASKNLNIVVKEIVKRICSWWKVNKSHNMQSFSEGQVSIN